VTIKQLRLTKKSNRETNQRVKNEPT